MSDEHRSMSRREFLRYGAAGVAAASIGWPGGPLAAAADRPNILFVLTDDQRWDAMSCMGHPFVKTPNMDRIAREGVMFDNAFVTTSLCSPSRASFLTGAYAHAHGVVDNAGKEFDPTFPTFPRILQAAGYETAFIGKWHMAGHANPRPGFDYWLSFVGQGRYGNPDLNENGRDFQAEGYMTDLLTDYAVNWLKRKRNKPFCLILSHKAVHGPFTPAPRHEDAFADASLPEPASFKDTFEGKPEWQRRAAIYGQRKAHWLASEGKPVPDSLPPAEWDGRNTARLDYYRALLAVDEGLGRVFETLEATGQMDSTFIVFAGDNGYFHGEHRRGDKRLMYEESLRIPLLMRYPAAIKPRTHVSEMCLNIDLAPTLLDLATVAAPETMQGRSVLPLLKGNRVKWRDSFLYEYFREDWMPGIPLMLGVRTERWKYVCYPDIEDIEELYDLQKDPHEMHNLAADAGHAPVLEDMRGRLRSLKRKTGYPEGVQLGAPPPAITLRADKPDLCVLDFDFTRDLGERAEDLSGRGNHGIPHGCRTVEADGGKALSIRGGEYIEVPRSERLDPSMGPWTFEACVKAEAANGIILAHGGQARGYAVYLKDSVPHIAVRIDGQVYEVAGAEPLGDGWATVAGVMGRDMVLKMIVDGKPGGKPRPAAFMSSNPNESLQVGTDTGTLVGSYEAAQPFTGLVRFVRIWAGDRSG